MISSRSEQTYNFYLNSYKKWCEKYNVAPETSLNEYKRSLILNKKSTAYIKNAINTISRKQNIPVFKNDTHVKKKLDQDFFKKICRQTYQQEEISIIILLLLETSMKLKEILNLTRADVENVISEQKLLNGKKISNNSMYLFEYLLSISFQKDFNEKYFKKTYHSYLYAFKNRQKELFPESYNQSFNCLK